MNHWLNEGREILKKETVKCEMFYTYDNHVGESRRCVNCGKLEEDH